MSGTGSRSRLRQVGDDQVLPEPAAPAPASISLLLLSLKALSQRALIAFENLWSLAVLGSVWLLFDAALPANPSPAQLSGLGMYGVFAIATLWLRR